MASKAEKSQEAAPSKVMTALAFLLRIIPLISEWETARRRKMPATSKSHIPADRVWAWIHPQYDRCGLKGLPNAYALYSAAVAAGRIKGVSMVAHPKGVTDKSGEVMQVPSIPLWTVLLTLKNEGKIAYNPRSGYFTTLELAEKHTPKGEKAAAGSGDLMALLDGTEAVGGPSVTPPSLS